MKVILPEVLLPLFALTLISSVFSSSWQAKIKATINNEKNIFFSRRMVISFSFIMTGCKYKSKDTNLPVYILINVKPLRCECL